jgi:hypothetical protein
MKRPAPSLIKKRFRWIAILALSTGLALGAVWATHPGTALADGGGFPTKTPTVTPTSTNTPTPTVTETPLPTNTLTAIPTELPTLTPLPGSVNQTPAGGGIVVTPQSPGTPLGLVCMPFALALILIIIILSTFLLTRRAEQG